MFFLLAPLLETFGDRPCSIKGTVKVNVETVLPLPEARKAQELNQTGHSGGRSCSKFDVRSWGVEEVVERGVRQAQEGNRKAEVQCWMEPGSVTILMGDLFTKQYRISRNISRSGNARGPRLTSACELDSRRFL